jgi:multicomponent Na+:H+ antiporter subunit G
LIASAIEIVIACLLLLGATLTLIAALGLFRLPDLYTRMHASSKAGTAGSGLLLLAVALQSGEADTWVKCLLAILFFFLTAPVSAHLLAKAAANGGQPLPPPEGNPHQEQHVGSPGGEDDGLLNGASAQ